MTFESGRRFIVGGMSSLRISRLAAISGVLAISLRFYESAGLLPAARTASGYRAYDEQAVERLAFIAAAKQLGLALEEIAGLLAVWQSGACADVRADLRPRIAARIADAEGRTRELQAFTAFLRQALDHLDALPDRAVRCDSECSFLPPAASVPPVPVRLSDRPGAQVVPERWRSAPVACSLTPDVLGAWRCAPAVAEDLLLALFTPPRPSLNEGFAP